MVDMSLNEETKPNQINQVAVSISYDGNNYTTSGRKGEY